MQGEVEAALTRILGAPHTVVGAGRTDAGAHARHMVASCRLVRPVDAARLARGLDAVLPEDVGVRAVSIVPPTFHARRDAAWKWYRYSLLVSEGRRPLLRRRTWHVRRAPELDRLRAGAAVLVGHHDFAAFAAAGSPRRTTARRLYAVGWTYHDECLHLDVVGNGFLYKMIRGLVGTLLREARAGGSPEDVAARMRTILASRDRTVAGPSAPAHGLCLMAVGMIGEDPARRLPPFLAEAVESAPRTSPGGRP